MRVFAQNALQHGFRPFVVRDACGDRNLRPDDPNLFDLQAKCAEVLSESQAFKILETASQA